MKNANVRHLEVGVKRKFARIGYCLHGTVWNRSRCLHGDLSRTCSERIQYWTPKPQGQFWMLLDPFRAKKNFYALFKREEVCVLQYLTQPFTLFSSQRAKHLKLSIMQGVMVKTLKKPSSIIETVVLFFSAKTFIGRHLEVGN